MREVHQELPSLLGMRVQAKTLQLMHSESFPHAADSVQNMKVKSMKSTLQFKGPWNKRTFKNEFD